MIDIYGREGKDKLGGYAGPVTGLAKHMLAFRAGMVLQSCFK